MSESPSAPGMLTTAAKFGGAVLRHAADGFREVAPAQVAQRLAVCQSCPACDQSAMVCRDCGCRLLLKARWASETCPQERWPKVE